MTQFSVKIKETKAQASKEKSWMTELAGIEDDISRTGRELRFKVAAEADLKKRIKKAASHADECRLGMDGMRRILHDVVELYVKEEQKIVDHASPEDSLLESMMGFLWKIGGQFGPVGALANTVYKAVTSDKGSGAAWAEMAKNGWDTGWKLDSLAVYCKKVSKKGASTKWKDMLKKAAGFDTDNFLKYMHDMKNSTTAWERAKMSLQRSMATEKRFWGNAKKLISGDDISKVAEKNIAKRAGSFALTGVVKWLENADSCDTTERAVAETVSETLIETGKNWAIGAAVTAGFAAAGFAAPVVVVGAATVVAGTILDIGCKWVTKICFGEEKDVTELLSDAVLDTGAAVAEGIRTGAKAVSKGVKTLWNNVTGGINSFFKPAFG